MKIEQNKKKVVSNKFFSGDCTMLLEYIKKLQNESFECWSEDAKNGYLTALKSVEEKLKAYNNASTNVQ